MNAPRDELFAATRLAANQYRAVVTRYLLHELDESVDGGRATDRERSTASIRSDHSLHLRGLLPLKRRALHKRPLRTALEPRAIRSRTTHCLFSDLWPALAVRGANRPDLPVRSCAETLCY